MRKTNVLMNKMRELIGKQSVTRFNRPVRHFKEVQANEVDRAKREVEVLKYPVLF